MWGIIATWRMALEGVTESASALAAGKPVSAAVVDAVAAVEDFPLYKSVGYGGLPTENGKCGNRRGGNRQETDYYQRGMPLCLS